MSITAKISANIRDLMEELAEGLYAGMRRSGQYLADELNSIRVLHKGLFEKKTATSIRSITRSGEAHWESWEIHQGHVFVGPTGFVPIKDEKGTQSKDDVCVEYGFRFQGWITTLDKFTSTSYANDIVKESIMNGSLKGIIISAMKEGISKVLK